MQTNATSHFFRALFAAVLLLFTASPADAAGNIDASGKYAWSTAAGWINFNPDNYGGVSVYPDHLEGYAWAENIGWIRLGSYTGGNPHSYANQYGTDYGVNHDGAGNLSGYAWAANAGWINFDPTSGGVIIDLTTGEFDGFAWSESVGWIHFKNDAVPYKVAIQKTTPNVSSSSLDGSYKAGDVIPVSVVFPQSIYLTGNPRLILETGNYDAILDLAGGNGTTTFAFDYTVAPGHASPWLDYRSANALYYDRATVQDEFGLLAILDLPAPGAPGSLSANNNLIIDGVPPAPPIVTGVASTNEPRPVWNWHSGGDGAGFFRYALDGGDFSLETADTQYQPSADLSDGLHFLSVQERDEAGNWSSSGTFSITVDRQEPAPPTVSGTTPTNNTRPEWRWRTEGGGQGVFQYSLDGGDFSAETTETSYIPTEDLIHGEHALAVQERDAVGNWSAAVSFIIDVDILRPESPAVSGPESTNDTTPTWTWRPGADGCGIYRFSLDGGALSAETPNTAYTSPDALEDGPHKLSVEEKDLAGNWSLPSSFTIDVDTEPPPKPTVSGQTPTKDATPVWTWGTVDGCGVFRFSLNGGVFSEETTATSFTPFTPLTVDETHALAVQERDEAGNWSASHSHVIFIDATAPFAPVVSSETPTNNPAPAWTWLSGGGGIGVYRISLDGGPFSPETADAAFVPADALEDGPHSLSVQEKDEVGNWSASGSFQVVIDTQAPSRPVVSGVTPSSDATPSWTWMSGGGGSGKYRHSLDGGSYSPETADTSFSPFSPQEDGPHVLRVEERDEAGNWSAAGSFEITVHTRSSIAEIAGAPAGVTQIGSATLDIGGDKIVSYRYNLDHSIVYSAERPVDQSIQLSDLADGRHTVAVIGKNDAGNWQHENNATTVSWTVDATPPEVTGIADEATSAKTATWNWRADEAATFRHLVDQNPDSEPTGAFGTVASASQQGGDGTFYLHVQAKDNAGNVGDVVTVSATLDNTPPVLSGLESDDEPVRGKTWTWTADEPAVYRHVVNTEPDMETFPDYVLWESIRSRTVTDMDGKWFIHVQAKDVAGNESETLTASAVLDNTPPVISGLFSDPAPTRTKTWTWSAAPGDLFRHRIDQDPGGVPDGPFNEIATAAKNDGDGVWYLHVQARDPSGNVSPTVTVYAALDNTPPAVTGLANDDRIAQGKVWYWAADEPSTYRCRIDRKPTWAEPDGFYTGVNTATQAAGDGQWYIHVQAKDAAGNESGVTSVYATLDNTSAALSGLFDDPVPTRSKTWIWASDELGAVFRYAIDQNPSGLPFGDYDATTTATQPDGDGRYYLHVQAMDALGNESAVKTVYAVMDNTAPAVTGLLDDAQPARNKTWNWSATERSTFRFAMDDDPAGRPAGDYAEINAADQTDGDGMFYLHVQAKDMAGNESPVTTVYAVLDNTAPARPEVFGVTPTNDPTPTWTWASGGGGGVYRYRLDDPDLDADPLQTTAAAFTPAEPLDPGTHTLYVAEQDAAGNWSAAASFAIAIDADLPAAPTVTGESPTNDPTPTWTWISDGGGVGVFQTRLDGDPWSAETRNTSFSPAGALSDGVHTLGVRERDAASNWSEDDNGLDILVDTTPPSPVVWDETMASPTGEIRPQWRWRSGGDGGGVFRCKLDDSRMDSGADLTETSAWTPSADLPEGTHWLYVQERDAAGNWSLFNSYALRIDATPPNPPRIIGPSPVNTRRPEWRWESGGGGTGVFRYRLDAPDLTDGATETQTHTFTPEDDLADGEHVLYVQERDDAGNWSAAADHAVFVDTALPDPPVRSNDAPEITSNRRPVWTWTSANGDGAWFRYRLNNPDLDALSTTTTEARYQPEAPLSDGENILYVQELDGAGNPSSAAAFSIRIDTGAPCSRAQAPAALHDETLTGAIEIQYTFADRYNGESDDCLGGTGVGVSRVELWVKGPGDEAFAPSGVADEGDDLDGVLSLALDPDAAPQGAYSFYTIAYDKAGNPEPRPETVDARTVYSADFAGYAVIAVGSVASKEGLTAHTKTAAGVYRRLLDRNFLVSDSDNHWTDPLDHVKFFTPFDDEPVPGRDDHTRDPEGGFPIEYRHALEYAVTEWAAQRMTEIPGPLYLILLDHGANDQFFLNGFSQVSAPQLDLWLETLEVALPENFDQPIVIVIGTCYAGSFIDNLAKPGRIIVTSTAPDEVSYRGPLTPGQYRDGEFFVNALFNELGHGYTLYDSYREAADLTAMHTDSGGTQIRAPYFDTALQHPYIEADGLPGDDGRFGAHDIGYRGDADAAKTVVLGYGPEAAPLAVARTGKAVAAMSYNATANRLWATVDSAWDDPMAVKVWVEIRKPGQLLENADAGRVTSLTVDMVDVQLIWDPADARYEAAWDGFWDPGKYTLFFYAMDPEGNISHPARTYVYKASAPTVPGDVNGMDGATLADVIIALKVAAGIVGDGPVYVEADVDGDGRIGLAEAVYGLREAAMGR